MTVSNDVHPLKFLTIVTLLSAVVIGTSAHDKITSTYECHVINNKDEGINECHCHVPGESPVKVSCEEDQPSMELLLILEKVDTNLYFGLRVEPEDTCAEYNISEYPYGTTLDQIKSKTLGGIFGAYENECFDLFTQVDIDHIVARKEAHDSGLCAADAQVKINFSNDLENIALASPSVNRSKSARDPADWLPDHNACWYVWQYLHIKRKYEMTIDEAEKNAIDKVLQDCSLQDLILEVDESCILPDASFLLREEVSEPS